MRKDERGELLYEEESGGGGALMIPGVPPGYQWSVSTARRLLLGRCGICST